MNSGFVTLNRKFFSHWIWEEKREFSKAEAWLDLIRSAAYASHSRMVRGSLVTVNRGEVLASLRFLGERWGWKKDKSASFLRCLESQTMIRRETRQGETVIILCNYDDYNIETGVSSDSFPDAFPDTKPTVTRQSADKYNNKNKGNKKKEEPLPLPFDSQEFLEAWERWKVYRKESKKPLTDSTVKINFRDFAKWGEEKSIEAIDRAIRYSWQGLFEPKNQKQNPSQGEFLIKNFKL